MPGGARPWLTSRYNGESWGEPSKRARQLPRKRSIAVGVRGNSRAGSTRISGTVPVERWLSGSKVRRLSISSSSQSMRYGEGLPMGNTSMMEPRRA